MSKKPRFAAALARAQEEPRKEDLAPDQGAGGGNWSMHARRGMEEIVEKAKGEAAKANEQVLEGILAGTLPLQIPEVLIEDLVGTDRIASSEDEEDGSTFSALVENIRTRGLRQPIRVRPLNAEWRPDPAFPRSVGSQRFALQSGRRRLAACRQLGIEPLAFISFASSLDEDGRADDLRERFFENVARKSLTTVENLYSIGVIYKEQGFSNHGQASQILGVASANISRGVALVEHFEEIGSQLDLKSATRRDIDDVLKDIRSNKPKSYSTQRRRASGDPGSAAALPFKKREIPLGVVKLRQTRKGTHILSLESDSLDHDKIEAIIKLLEQS